MKRKKPKEESGITLIEHLEEIQETTTKRVNQIISDLKAKSDLTEDMKNTHMLY